MDQEMIQLITARAGDADTVADFCRKTFYDSFASQNTRENMDKFMNEQFSREKLIREVEDFPGCFLLALRGVEVVGYARWRESENPSGLGNVPSLEIARIYVARNMAGAGIGGMLMEQCLDTATRMGKKIAWLGVWEHNHPAISFYKKWQFEKFGEHIFMLGDDPQTDWLMKRNLVAI
jgi:ribosomal protein S18 acetylase RimI-like enzyme